MNIAKSNCSVAVKRAFPVIVVQNTGRISDALASLVSVCQKNNKALTCEELELTGTTGIAYSKAKNNNYLEELEPWHRFLQEVVDLEKITFFKALMDQVLHLL